MDQKKQKAALALKQDAGRSIREICEIVGISRTTSDKYTRTEDQPVAKHASAATPPTF